jgi:2'-5' RNA ligase
VPGHSVLQLPVPALEEWVRARTAHYDEGFVSTDARFGHAHVTALGPFDPAPSDVALAAIAALAAATAPIRVRLAELAQFPNGIIHLVPDPDDRLRDLTARLVAAFPGWPPYGGEFGDDVQPHLTVDAASDDVDLASTAALLAAVVPIDCVLDRLQLAWWESGDCRVVHEWRRGGGPASFSWNGPRRRARRVTLGPCAASPSSCSSQRCCSPCRG